MKISSRFKRIRMLRQSRSLITVLSKQTKFRKVASNNHRQVLPRDDRPSFGVRSVNENGAIPYAKNAATAEKIKTSL